jgi:hypothetical protein
MIEGLQFDAERHVYRFKGKIVPGVTTVLEPLQLLDGVPWAVLEAARDFGTNVHLACHLWNMGTLNIEALDRHLLPYLFGWRDFLRDTGFKVRHSEEPVFNAQLGYAGTPDVVGDYAAASWVVDIKSGVVPSTVGPQTAAYQNALDPKPRKRLCVQLKADGGYKMLEQKDAGDFALFVSALNIHKFRAKRKPADVSEYT